MRKTLYKKESQKFVAKGLSAVTWDVECIKFENRDGYYEGYVSAYFEISDDLKTLFIDEKKDLKAIRNLRAELCKFEDAAMDAYEMADRINGEDGNAEE